ncbi:MAG: sigma-54 dependent transcriptional regulator [Planctomycetota bacterium]
MTGKARRRVAFVDDDSILRRVLSREIEAFGYEVHAFGCAEDLLAAMPGLEPDLAVIDLNLPGMGGMKLLEALQAGGEDLPVVVLTGHGGVAEAVEAMRLGAYDFLTKPVSLDLLERVLERAVERRRLLVQNRSLRNLAAGGTAGVTLLGSSAVMRALAGDLDRIAASGAPVLIQGENGTGKELVARTLHDRSERGDRPFVVVNCGAIPEGLVESELFGHVKGAFTGAERRRTGLFEAADGGTIFLDEIGELPMSVQPALLRAIQFGELRPVGSEHAAAVDARVLAATNRDLLAEVEAGNFREDLYYRLAALIVQVPPLRARRGDIGELAAAFLVRQQVENGCDKELAPEAVEALERYDWPGNVRELENAIVRLCTLVRDRVVGAEAVEAHVSRRRRLRSDGLPTLALEELERLAVEEAMRRHGGSKPKAAAELGVSLKTLYNKLARYGKA